MSEKDSERSFGELPTLGRAVEPERPAPDPNSPSWTALGLSEAETLKPGEGIRDDGRTDGVRRWKAGEEILGRYMVERELGQGGMGVVYGCLDKVGGVRVAVKGLPPELSHDSVEMEEVRENFRLVGDLRHPCIAGVRTLEKDERGEFYLVMDLAEGESLRKWERDKWKAGGVSLAEAVGVLRQVASALDYAHRRKVVHRDVKPGNVMIDGKGEVKVLDFGLADQIRTSLSRASHANRGTSGTGPYMSPEQWRGQPQDGKTDQYALGVMAYEMLAGRLPFGSSDLGVLREVVLKEEPSAIPGLPESAMGAIRRAMAKRAEERFGSCGEFVEVLEGKGKAGGAGGRRSARGRSLVGWAVALAVLAGAVGAGVWGWRESGKGVGRLEGQENAVGETARPEGSPHQEGVQLEAEKSTEEEQLAAARWVEENAPLREAAVRARDAAVAAKEKADAVDGGRLNVPSYQRGNERSTEGTNAFQGGQFKEATEAWNAAVEAYGQAETEARAAENVSLNEAAVRANNRRMQVRTPGAVVYSRPEATAPDLGRVSAGDIVFVSRTEGAWAAISSPPPSVGVWINRDFVDSYRVSAKSIQVRSGPGLDHDIVGTLQRGAPALVLEESGNWWKISPPSSMSVWVREDCLQEVADSPSVRIMLPPNNMQNHAFSTSLSSPQGASQGTPQAAPSAPVTEEWVDPTLVAELHLRSDVPDQGRPRRVTGQLRNAPLATATPSRYRLLVRTGGEITTLCYIHGSRTALSPYSGKNVSIYGKEYWVDEDASTPVLVVGQIAPAEE